VSQTIQECEICGALCDRDDLSACEECGKMFCPCCNSLIIDTCVECAV
jgi:hypothetical protein